MITEKQWESHPSFQADLAKLLTSPVMETALQICVTKAMTHVPIPAGANLIHWQSMMGSKREGCFETIQFLRQLATPPAAKTLGKKPWESEPPPPETPAK